MTSSRERLPPSKTIWALAWLFLVAVLAAIYAYYYHAKSRLPQKRKLATVAKARLIKHEDSGKNPPPAKVISVPKPQREKWKSHAVFGAGLFCIMVVHRLCVHKKTDKTTFPIFVQLLCWIFVGKLWAWCYKEKAVVKASRAEAVSLREPKNKNGRGKTFFYYSYMGIGFLYKLTGVLLCAALLVSAVMDIMGGKGSNKDCPPTNNNNLPKNDIGVVVAGLVKTGKK